MTGPVTFGAVDTMKGQDLAEISLVSSGGKHSVNNTSTHTDS